MATGSAAQAGSGQQAPLTKPQGLAATAAASSRDHGPAAARRRPAAANPPPCQWGRPRRRGRRLAKPPHPGAEPWVLEVARCGARQAPGVRARGRSGAQWRRRKDQPGTCGGARRRSRGRGSRRRRARSECGLASIGTAPTGAGAVARLLPQPRQPPRRPSIPARHSCPWGSGTAPSMPGTLATPGNAANTANANQQAVPNAQAGAVNQQGLTHRLCHPASRILSKAYNRLSWPQRKRVSRRLPCKTH